MNRESFVALDETDAYRRQHARDVEQLATKYAVPSRVLARDEPCADPEQCDVHETAVPAEPEPVKPTLPAVPSWVTDVRKWQSLSRAERRALERHHRRRVGRGH